MALTFILTIVTLVHVVSVVYAGVNDRLIAELRARHPELNISPLAGLLLFSARWILAALWVAHAVETGDFRYAFIGLVPVACWIIQRLIPVARGAHSRPPQE